MIERFGVLENHEFGEKLKISQMNNFSPREIFAKRIQGVGVSQM